MATPEQLAKHAANQRAYRLRHPGRVAELERRYVATPEGRAARGRARDEWRQRHPVEAAAHAAVTKAVLRGQLVKGPCVVCGDTPTDGHHANGYDREHRLDVVWLCRPHHQEAHEQLRMAG